MATALEYFPVGTQTFAVNSGTSSSSSSFTLGIESAAINNVSTLDLDHLVTGGINIGSGGGSTGTQVQVWVVPVQTDDLGGTVTWPDVFDGTNSQETVTSYGVLQGCGRLAQVINVDSVGGLGKDYYVSFSVASLFGGVLPSRYVLFITHNTGTDAVLPNTGTTWKYQRIQATVS